LSVRAWQGLGGLAEGGTRKHLRPISRLRLLGRLLLAGLSWDHGTRLDDEFGGIPDTPFLLSLRLWFRHAPIMTEPFGLSLVPHDSIVSVPPGNLPFIEGPRKGITFQ
jgi:hypothetical protein